jgi:hypothetical protein
MNPDTLPTTHPTVTRHRDGTITINFGAGALNYPNADDAATFHAYIVQEIYRTEKRAQAAEKAAEAIAQATIR